MPLELLILIGLLLLVAVLFIFAKRPIYEIMAVAFLFVIAVSNQWSGLPAYLLAPATSSLFFVIFAFMVVASVFDATKVVNQIIKIMLALVGKIPGAAGYVALMGSTFMASLSGSGPGNVATTGVFTIPMMKRSGYPPHVAASVEMSASMLGNVIPPASIIFLTYGIYTDTTGEALSMSQWLVAAYAIGAWYFLQRLVTLAVVAKVNKVKPLSKEEIPRLGEALREGWPAFFLPALIFIPLFLDAQLPGLLTARLGEDGAEAFSSSVLMFTPGLAFAYAIAIGWREISKNRNGFTEVFHTLRGTLAGVVPIAATIYFAYATSEAFAGMEGEEQIRDWFVSLNLPLWTLLAILPLFFALLGMILPGTAQVAILGGAMIAVVAALDGNPLLFAVLLPAMTGALEGMTPPLALGLFVAMGIAKSDFTKTVKYALIWIGAHLAVTFLLIAGLLPVLGT